ncbi:MAG: hypothetical protein JWL81_889 [Verrucomicrobiales bacterium]|nr:hypothetical protein [Verrucomicrobiales bacterium]
MKPPLLRPKLSAVMSRFSSFSAAALLAAALIFQSAPAARASVDDSHSAAMEIAVDAVKAGFKIRQEYWSGTLKSGEQKIVKQQLFKGNEYWFFLGTDAEKIGMKIDIFDRKGNKVTVETKTVDNATAIRVLAPATGTYLVVFSLTGKENDPIPWALAYGYR